MGKKLFYLHDHLLLGNLLFYDQEILKPVAGRLEQDNESWLEFPYQNHAITLTVHILNEDYEKEANNVRVGFYDIPENETETLIGYIFVDNIANASRRGEAILPGTSPALIVWNQGSGTNVLGTHNLTIRIDPLNEVEEWIENDNNFTFRRQSRSLLRYKTAHFFAVFQKFPAQKHFARSGAFSVHRPMAPAQPSIPTFWIRLF